MAYINSITGFAETCRDSYLLDREKDRESLWFLSRDSDLSLRRSLERDLDRIQNKTLRKRSQNHAGKLRGQTDSYRLRLRLRLLLLGDLKKRRGKASERTIDTRTHLKKPCNSSLLTVKRTRHRPDTGVEWRPRNT